MKNHLAVGLLCLCAAASVAQPVAQLPTTYINTTFSMPTGGTNCAAHTAAQYSSCLKSANPGDIITLDAGTIYSGNFNVPAKSNPSNKWIYIISSKYANLPPPGTRVSPADAANMPKIVTPNSVDTTELLSGANHYRFVGLEIYSASNVGYTTGGLINSHAALTNLPDSITVDRCYIHGSPSIKVQRGVQMIGSSCMLKLVLMIAGMPVRSKYPRRMR